MTILTILLYVPPVKAAVMRSLRGLKNLLLGATHRHGQDAGR